MLRLSFAPPSAQQGFARNEPPNLISRHDLDTPLAKMVQRLLYRNLILRSIQLRQCISEERMCRQHTWGQMTGEGVRHAASSDSGEPALTSSCPTLTHVLHQVAVIAKECTTSSMVPQPSLRLGVRQVARWT